jgi:ABC-type amino acid transport substrate-binding protein
MNACVRTGCGLLLAIALAVPASAAREWTDALSGRLAHIKATGVVHLGYREDAIPFSYLGADGAPVGYSLDLCRAIVATLADDLGVPSLAVEYVRVTAQDRVQRVAGGEVDLECGATTSTAQRRQFVAFSPVIFVTGTRIAVARGSAIRGVEALAGKRVAVVGGTTNETAMREIDRRHGLRVTFVVAADYREALDAVATGGAVALAADEALLRGVLLATERSSQFRIVGELLSFEPYGIMFPRDDPAFAELVGRSLRDLAGTREIVWIYDRWFTRPLPSGGSLDLPMGVQLRRSFELLGLPPD